MRERGKLDRDPDYRLLAWAVILLSIVLAVWFAGLWTILQQVERR